MYRESALYGLILLCVKSLLLFWCIYSEKFTIRCSLIACKSVNLKTSTFHIFNDFPYNWIQLITRNVSGSVLGIQKINRCKNSSHHEHQHVFSNSPTYIITLSCRECSNLRSRLLISPISTKPLTLQLCLSYIIPSFIFTSSNTTVTCFFRWSGSFTLFSSSRSCRVPLQTVSLSIYLV